MIQIKKWHFKKKKKTKRNYLSTSPIHIEYTPHLASFQVPIALKNMNICFLDNRNRAATAELYSTVQYQAVPSANNLTTLCSSTSSCPVGPGHIGTAQGTSSANNAIGIIPQKHTQAGPDRSSYDTPVPHNTTTCRSMGCFIILQEIVKNGYH